MGSQLQKTFEMSLISPLYHTKKTQAYTGPLPTSLLRPFSSRIPEEQVQGASKAEKFRKKGSERKKVPSTAEKKRKNTKSMLKESGTRCKEEQGEPKWSELL